MKGESSMETEAKENSKTEGKSGKRSVTFREKYVTEEMEQKVFAQILL